MLCHIWQVIAECQKIVEAQGPYLGVLQKVRLLLMTLFHQGGPTASYEREMTLSKTMYSCAPLSNPAHAKDVDEGPYQTPLRNLGG